MTNWVLTATLRMYLWFVQVGFLRWADLRVEVEVD